MKPAFLIFSVAILVFSIPLFAQRAPDAKLIAGFDEIVNSFYAAKEPGAVALVASKGKVLYHTAVGMANVELEVPMKTDNVFRIGSITKQFTAICILQLMEQGKLSLQDDIKKFLPDYPTHGHTITIEHLLTHTSGIKSYTSMDKFGEVMRLDKKPEEFLSFFKNEPMDFAPGTKWEYNNSGYFLLGVIIEKITGKSYANYLEDNLFKPLGMKRSYYGSDARIIPGRAAGYDEGSNGIENAAPLSMTLPYAAGSIQGTVEDLYTWHKALHSYKLVKMETLDKAFTRYKLKNGESTNYGYGWFMSTVQGSPSIEHGGGINGFLTDALYLPEHDLFVAVFSNNTTKGPSIVSNKLAALAIGKPLAFKRIPLDSISLQAYPAVYQWKENEERIITFEDGKLYSMRTGGSKFEAIPMAPDKFFFEKSLTWLEFKRDAGGKVTSVVSHEKDGDKEWKRTNKPLPKQEAVKLSVEELDRLVGEYPLTAAFVMTVTREGERLFAQATGQQKIEIFPLSALKFFPKQIEATIEFELDAATGKAGKLILNQGGRRMEAKRK